MQIDPMTFSEFIIANGDENLADYLETVNVLCHRRYAGISPDVDTGP